MLSLKNLFKSTLIVSLFLSSSGIALAAEHNTAVIDVNRIYKEYSLVVEANQELDKSEESFKKLLTTADAELKDLEAKGTKPEDLEAKKTSIQAVIDEQVKKVQAQKDSYNQSINTNFKNVMDQVAKQKKLDLILDRSFVIYPYEDITEEFLQKLESSTKANQKKES